MTKRKNIRNRKTEEKGKRETKNCADKHAMRVHCEYTMYEFQSRTKVIRLLVVVFLLSTTSFAAGIGELPNQRPESSIK